MKLTATATSTVSVSVSATATAESKSVAPRAEVSKVASEAKVAAGFVKGDEFVGGGRGCWHPPFPLKPADAGTRNTQGKQMNEIADGVRSGSLTAKESEALLKEQKAIADYQKTAMADGKLSTEEKLKLAVMQGRAELNIHRASHNSQRDVFAPFKETAQRQADQIDRVAEGRKSGNITNTEAGELIGDQADISHARQNGGGLLGNLVVNSKLNQADREITHHSKPGTQWDIKPFPLPFPRPEPKPFPLPFPRPEFPSKPEIQLPFFKGVING